MKHLIFVMTVLAVITLSATALRSAGGKTEQADPTEDARKMAMIMVTRHINVAEIDQQMAAGSFADWNVLAQSKSIQKQNLQIPLKVEVRVFAAADGKHFSVVLKDTQDPSLYTVFSDETGIIFQGQTVGNAPGVTSASAAFRWWAETPSIHRATARIGWREGRRWQSPGRGTNRRSPG